MAGEVVVTERIVVIGMGSSGQRFVETILTSLPEAEILAVSSRKVSFPGVSVTASLSDVVAFNPTVAVICGSASARLETVRALPQSVQGILLEKPISTDLPTAIELRDALEELNVVVGVGYNLRYSPSLQDFKRRVDNRELGKVLSIRAETGQYLPSWRSGRDYRDTVSAQRELGGGVLLELSHEIDYLRWIFGEPDWVSAWVGKQSEFDIDVEDDALLTIGFEGCGESDTIIGQVSLDFLRHDKTRSLHAVCEAGSLTWDGVRGAVHVFREGADAWQEEYSEQVGGPSSYDLQWQGFAELLNQRPSPGASIGDGLAVMSVIDSAWTSHQSQGLRTPVNRAEQDS